MISCALKFKFHNSFLSENNSPEQVWSEPCYDNQSVMLPNNLKNSNFMEIANVFIFTLIWKPLISEKQNVEEIKPQSNDFFPLLAFQSNQNDKTTIFCHYCKLQLNSLSPSKCKLSCLDKKANKIRVNFLV